MKKTDDAVSPVVGIMLMLVVTIIIAAVVSTMAGGLMTSTDPAPQATFSAASTIEKIPDTDKTNAEPDAGSSTAVNGIIFRHMGGDTIALNDIKIQLGSSSKQMTFTLDVIRSDTSIVPDTQPVIQTSDGSKTYFSVGTRTSTVLNPGDSFTIFADTCYDSTKAPNADTAKGQFLVWQPKESSGRFTAQLNDNLEYSIIDRNSGHTIQTGVINLQ